VFLLVILLFARAWVCASGVTEVLAAFARGQGDAPLASDVVVFDRILIVRAESGRVWWLEAWHELAGAVRLTFIVVIAFKVTARASAVAFNAVQMLQFRAVVT